MLLKREDVNDKKEKMRMGKEAKWKLYQGKVGGKCKSAKKK